MTAPDDAQQLDIAEVAAEMAADPLSKALFENAQLRVMARKLSAQNQILADRVRELEGQDEERKPRGDRVPPIAMVDALREAQRDGK